MSRKTSHLQIRVSPEQKRALQRRAQQAGQGLSAFVLSRVLPETGLRFEQLVEALRQGEEPGFALAEINDLLTAAPAGEMTTALSAADLTGLSPYLQNYLAAMVELAAHRKGVPPPPWVRRIEPLEMPHFATPLKSLRPYLLRAAPVPFKRRNIFVDASVGDRV
jgi:hypothetical protein